jgi:outer membrane protein assembly factor BamA
MHVRLMLVLGVCLALIEPARADEPRPIVGFRVEGDSKVTSDMLGYLLRVELGDLVNDAQIPLLERALVSSQLVKSAKVRFEPAPDGVVVVATLDDKQSWIVMPTAYLLATNWAAGLGFAENNLFGENKKLLLYGQIGKVNSFFVAAYVVPSFRGTKLSLRFDTYLQRRIFDEYANPVGDPESKALGRTSDHLFMNLGAAAGWNLRWWWKTEMRLRGAVVRYWNAHVPEDPATALPRPSPDGYDVTTQLRTTLDAREHDHGVTEGPYGQLAAELPIPGLTSYVYASVVARAFYALRFLRRHQLELRTYGNLGYHMPFHDEWTLGAASDLRGYAPEQFRGDVRALARLEYSVPLASWRVFTFRGLGFFDTGYLGFHFTDPSLRSYLPDQVGRGIWRNDVGGGLRIYVSNIVLPLLGLDVGYGLENHSPTLYLQIGLTDL